MPIASGSYTDMTPPRRGGVPIHCTWGRLKMRRTPRRTARMTRPRKPGLAIGPIVALFKTPRPRGRLRYAPVRTYAWGSALASASALPPVNA
jgi:hypothetical protein